MLRALRDRIEIKEAAYRLWRAIDLRDLDLYDTCLTPGVRVEYPFGSWQGLAEQKRMAQATSHQQFNWTHHVVANALIEIDGDRATAQYLLAAWHALPTEAGERVVTGGAVYDQELLRGAGGWRIDRHVCSRWWIEDGEETMSDLRGLAAEPERTSSE